MERVLACYGLSIDDVSDKIITPSVDDDDLDDLKLKNTSKIESKKKC